jgi:hypothetical protein
MTTASPDPVSAPKACNYALTFTLIAGHDRFHLAQARAALDRVRGRG